MGSPVQTTTKTPPGSGWVEDVTDGLDTMAYSVMYHLIMDSDCIWEATTPQTNGKPPHLLEMGSHHTEK